MRLATLVGTAAVVLLTASAASAQPRTAKRVPEREVLAAKDTLLGADAAAAVKAAESLGAVANKTATAALIEALALGLKPPVAIAALGALGVRRDDAAFETLEYYLKVRSKAVRAASANALAGLGKNPEVNRALVKALGDPTELVRAAAAAALAGREATEARAPLIALVARGEMSAARALSAIGDAEVARQVAELIGRAPNGAVAEVLGRMLNRRDFGPDSLRVEVVRALGKIPGNAGIEHLAAYVAETPEKPPRASRREAEALVTDRL